MSKLVDIGMLGLAAMTVGLISFLPQFPLHWGIRSTDVCCLIGFAACTALSTAELFHNSKAKEQIQQGIKTYFVNLAIFFFLTWFLKVWLYYLVVALWKYFEYTLHWLFDLYNTSLAMPSFSSLPMLLSGVLWAKLGPGLFYGYTSASLWVICILGLLGIYSTLGVFALVHRVHPLFGGAEMDDDGEEQDQENTGSNGPPSGTLILDGAAE